MNTVSNQFPIYEQAQIAEYKGNYFWASILWRRLREFQEANSCELIGLVLIEKGIYYELQN